VATAHHKDGKLADLGASVIAPNGTLVSVFGDTFSGNRVGEGDWRSPVILIGTGDASIRSLTLASECTTPRLTCRLCS
jgi:hypothetical protein